MRAFVEHWTGLWLVDPELLLALLVPVLVLLRRRSAARPSVVVGALAALEREAGGAPLPRAGRARLSFVPPLFASIGLGALAVALARPVERVPEPLETRGVDLALCLDVSSSMSARDLDPERTRLELAREAAERFALARTEDRLALLRFARYCDLVVPPTGDERAVAALLERVEVVPTDGAEDATGVGLAVARAVELLEGRGSSSKAVVLLTDGMENVARGSDGVAPLDAARLARARGVRVYAIAAGRTERGAGGAEVELDTSELERLAEHTGGAFFRADDAGALDGAWAAIDRLERVELLAPRFAYEERFAPFALCGLGLLVAAAALARGPLEILP